MAKTIWREPTEDDPRRRVYRTNEEMRFQRVSVRISRREMDDLYQYARSHRATMSYMIRQALAEVYPDIFRDANRHIRKPKKAYTIPKRTQITQSYNDGRINISTDTE